MRSGLNLNGATARQSGEAFPGLIDEQMQIDALDLGCQIPGVFDHGPVEAGGRLGRQGRREARFDLTGNRSLGEYGEGWQGRCLLNRGGTIVPPSLRVIPIKVR